MAKRQQKYRIDWDATDGRNGGAQRTVWEVLMDMERFNGKAEDRGAVALVQDLAKALSESAFLWWALCRYFEHQRRVQFEV